MAIRYIIETHYTRRDVNGNVYAISLVTRCSTGKSVHVPRHWGSRSEVAYGVRRAFGLDCTETYEVDVRDVKKREHAHTAHMWARQASAVIHDPCCDVSALKQAFADV